MSGVVLLLDRVGRVAERERDREPVARHLVERVADDADVLRLLGLAAVEVGGRGKLERQRLAFEHRRAAPRRAATRRESSATGPREGPSAATRPVVVRARAAAPRRGLWPLARAAARPVSAARARARQPRQRRPAAGAGAPVARCSSWSTRNASDSRERSEPGLRHLHERELERQPRVGALPRVLDRDREQVAEAEHGRRRQLVRLLAQPLARLVGDGQRVGHVAHVLHEQQVAQVLEQVGDEPAEVLALLGELLEEDERARGVAVDDRVAEAEERVLLDGAEQLQHRLDVDRVPGRGGELVERRDGVAERAARAARDQRERGVGHLDLLGVRDPAQHADELRQPRPREDERLAARAHGRQHLRAGRSCRRRRRGAAAAPRSASGARSTRRR